MDRPPISTPPTDFGLDEGLDEPSRFSLLWKLLINHLYYYEALKEK